MKTKVITNLYEHLLDAYAGERLLAHSILPVCLEQTNDNQ